MPTKVSDYMTSKVITVPADYSVRKAFFLMREQNIRHLPVVCEEKQLLGIVSDRELRRPNWVDEEHDIEHVYYLDDHMTVGDIMIKDVHVLHTYDTLSKAVKEMLDWHVGAAPVLDKPGNLVGMLSAVDLLRALSDILENQKGAK
jgi:acetoin utilization protein AcuB